MRHLVPQFILENFAAGKTHGGFSAVGLFVDISGFSILTDELTAHGQHGAEILAGVIRAAFEPLIQSVFEQGGFIATQAGDAFTALFQLEEHDIDGCRRALAASWNLQKLAAVRRQYPTPYGEFTISVKVGLALGETTWGILTSEDGNRAIYYFQGSAVDESAEAEHQARAGEIIINSSLAEQLQGFVTAEPAGDYFRLVRVLGKLPDSYPKAPAEVELDLAARFFPIELLTLRSTGEFRQVVNLFISLPTIRTEAQLKIFMRGLFTLQSRYGGLLKGLDFGDKGANLLLLWGTPAAHENDVDRALHFILELQTQTTIPINGGITYRVAHAGFIGSWLHEEYTAYGSGVNLAARFMTAAPRGEIWVDENIARLVQGQYDLEYIGEKKFKGFTQPQKVYTLLERREETELVYEGRLVGRENELQQLVDFVQPIFKGEFPGILVVWGEPGMGKSRLVHEFLHSLAVTDPGSFRVFRAQTDEILRESLNPFRYWLMSYFGISANQTEARNKRSFNHKLDELIAATTDRRLADELDRTRSFLGAQVGLSWPDSLYEFFDAQDRYENTFIGVINLLKAESRQRPLIFFLEDAHWLDDDSKAFLPRLVRTLTAEEGTSYPLALLLTARFEGAGLPLDGFTYREIKLDQLNRGALRALVESFLGGHAQEGLLDLLARRAEGNPFFAEQILRYLKEGNLLTQDKDEWGVVPQQSAPLPGDVSALLIARLDRLTQEVKENIQTAAVLGREFEVRLLAHMWRGNSPLADVLAQAEQAAVWYALNEIRYLFKHALLRDAAYRMQLRARRQALHALAMEAIETLYSDNLKQQYWELAHHAERAGQIDKARLYLQLAGDAAREAYQNTLALDGYRRALDLTPENEISKRYELLLALDSVHELLGEKEERQQDLQKLEKLSEELGDIGKKALVALRKADYAYDIGKIAQSIAFSEEAAGLALSVQDTNTAIEAYNLLSSSLLRQNNFKAAFRQAEIGLGLASKVKDRLNQSRLLNNLGMIANEQGKLALARGYFEQSLTIGQEVGNLRAQALPLNNLGMVVGLQGNYQSAQMYYEQSLAITRQIGFRSTEGVVLGNLGWISGRMGEFKRARSYAEQNLQIAREVGDPYSEAYASINLSAYLEALEEYDIALRCAEQGLDISHQIGEQSAEAWALTYLGHICLALGKISEAAEAYQNALDLRRSLGQPSQATEPQAGLAQAALAAGDLSSAKVNLENLLVYLEQGGTLDSTDQPLRIYLTCYKVLQATGDPRAEKILENAYSLLQEAAAAFPEKAARQAFLENISQNNKIVAAWDELQAAREMGRAG